MFNLEESVLEWRRRMLSAGVKDAEILDELESHLREDWARRVELGAGAEKAFEEAVEGVGDAGALKEEFAKVGGGKWAWLKKLKEMMGGEFVPEPVLSGFSPGALRSLELAREEAPRLKHGFVGTEHVLLGLLAMEEGVVANVLKRMGVERERVRREVEKWVSGFPTSKIDGEVPYTPRVKKSLSFAAKEAESQKAAVGAEHILLGLILESEGVAGRVLRDLGVSAEATRLEIKRR